VKKNEDYSFASLFIKGIDWIEQLTIERSIMLLKQTQGKTI
jgi:hypothetical protein